MEAESSISSTYLPFNTKSGPQYLSSLIWDVYCKGLGREVVTDRGGLLFGNGHRPDARGHHYPPDGVSSPQNSFWICGLPFVQAPINPTMIRGTQLTDALVQAAVPDLVDDVACDVHTYTYTYIYVFVLCIYLFICLIIYLYGLQ